MSRLNLPCCLASLTLLSGLPAFAAPAAAERLAACPISLTNPDGQALNLERYDLRLAVHGPLALTEMEMVFRNPLAKQMEGRFLYLLPPGATVSRFAKEVDGKLMEGEVVEKLRAQHIYTEILQTMRDPALLEQDQGNRFSARVFPIAANGTVRLVLSYSQVAALKNGERRITVPLAGLPKMGEFTYRVVLRTLAGEKVSLPTGLGTLSRVEEDAFSAERQLKNYQPEEDFVLTVQPVFCTPPASALRAGNYQMLCYRPTLPPPSEKDLIRDWTLYIDTSASNADTEPRRLEALDTLVKALDLNAQISLRAAYAFDIDVTPLSDAKSGKNRPLDLPTALRRRHCLGATNLEAALKHLGFQARATETPHTFILVSDGIATLGAREPRELLAALGDWPARHRLHALAIGPKQDRKTLEAVVAAAHGRVVEWPLVQGFAAKAAQVISELSIPPGADFECYDEAAAWIYPKTFRDVRPGGELVVFSQLKDGAAAKPGVLRRGLDGKKEHDVPLDKLVPAEVPPFAPLLEREAHAAFLNHLEQLEQQEKDAAKREALRKQRLEVSLKSRVLCPLTSLLVLETENDYARFGIERTALADILIVGKDGIELKHRAAGDLVVRASPPPARVPKNGGAPKPAATGGNGRPAELGDDAKDATPELKLDDHAGAVNGDVAAEPGAAAQAGETDARYFALGARHASELNVDLARQGPGSPAPEPRPTPDGHGAAHDPAAPFAPPAMPPNPAQAPVTTPTGDHGTPVATTTVNRVLLTGHDAAGVAPPGKPAAPDWTKQYGLVPADGELDALRAKIAAAPADRNLRNELCDALFKAAKWDALQAAAFEWIPFDAENPQVYEYLAKSATGLRDANLALRAATSIAEIAPNRAALLARAGWLLLVAQKYEWAEQMFREALKNRQDDANIYRGLALTLWQTGRHEDALKVLDDALKLTFHERYGDVKRVMREEMGYIFRSWNVPERADGRFQAWLTELQNKLPKKADALRVTLGWETDANDVDLHVVDPNGEECFYSHKQNASGLELYSDQTQGLGPEVIRCDKVLPGTYHVAVNYFSAGPMGVSRGVVVILQPDKDGLAKDVKIIPFCLISGGPDMRHLSAIEVPK